MFDPAEALSGYERSPADLLRLLVSILVVVVVVVLTKLLADAVGDLQNDFVDLLAITSTEATRILEGLLSLIGIVLGLLTLLLPLLTRRLRTFGYVLIANIACALVMAATDAWLGIDGAVNKVALRAGVSLEFLPDATAIAQTAAVIVVFSPFVTRRWRQMLWSLFGAMLVLQILISVYSPAATVVALAVGPAVGSATLLAFGRPTSRPTLAAIVDSLRAAGLQIDDIEPAAVDARGSTPYFATLAGGSRVFVKVLGANERAADLLFRFYRRLRLRNVGDERPDSSLRRTVEHEALVSLQARDVSVTTPRMRAVARVGQDSFLLAYDLIPGASLDSVPSEELDTGVLQALWEQVGLLRRHRIAHRDLRLANVFLDEQSTPWIIDFGFAEVAADDTLLRADVAQLLASLAVAVGARRATESAVATLGADAVGGAAPRLQLPALSGATQTALKEQSGLLDELRSEVISRCGIEEPNLDPLTRFRPSNGALLAIAAAVLYVGLPLLAGFDDVSDILAGAQWGSLGGLLVAVVVVELALGWSLYSCPPLTLPAWPTLMASSGSVFASTTAPSGLGGTGLRVRFLERQGVTPTGATGAIAFAGAANVLSMVGLLIAFVVWAGGSALDSVRVDRPEAFWAGLAILAGLAVVSFAVPDVRARMRDAAAEGLGLARVGLSQLGGSPSRVVTTFCASLTLALAHMAALDVSLTVMDQQLALATTGVIFLAGSLLASLVPTPGHLAAIEVMLIAGLMASGIPAPTAVCAVLLYRLAAFWLPILIGWGAFRWLRRTDLL